jgi:hypothetical protein
MNFNMFPVPVTIPLLLHTNLSTSSEVCDSPEQTTRRRILAVSFLIGKLISGRNLVTAGMLIISRRGKIGISLY